MREYKLVRSKRKTIAIHILEGLVEVRAPMKTPKRVIDEFVASKEKWIADKLLLSLEQGARRETFSLTYGDKALYRGREYPIVARPGNGAGFDGETFYLPPGLTPPQIKAVCIWIYRLLAKDYLTERTADFARRMGVWPSKIRISDANSRWGSCSAKGSINLSWRLMMADDAVIDYVAVHELAHLKELNHSGRFWAEVEDVLPDWRERKQALRELQKRLVAQDWTR
ncbi:MAG: M48 family metallopeptidase [Oscillospiraceae bacterium]|nr:M48 family metallopeptidase [Oscillospiraceae bacterium]